ncbi:MAG: HAMP domain-containing histidine kinase [Rhodocyclaceae bacterium]|nr:HAMP domain-containing histidine kinase [Rhodocyclaceae bacterium]
MNRPDPDLSAEQHTRLDLRVLDNQNSAVLRSAPSMVFATALAAYAMHIYFRHGLPEGMTLFPWMWIIGTVSAGRLLALSLWRRDAQAEQHARAWSRVVMVLSALTGLSWSLLATWLLPTEESHFRPAIAALMMGISAAVVVSHVNHFRAYAIYLTCMLLPAILNFAQQESASTRTLAPMLIFFLILLLVGGRRSARANERSIRLQMRLEAAVAAEEGARRAAEEANLAKNQFLMNMSHELRTPMHAVLAYAQLGIEKGEEERLKRYFERIQSSARGLLVLLGDLLDLARLESGRMAFTFRPVDLVQLVDATVAEFSPEAQKRGIALAVEGTFADVRFALDEARFMQVLRNLVSNALKFSPEGSTIALALTRPGDGGFRLSVTDEGIGIPDDELERVFDKFVQSSKTRTGAGGTGLGLAICREIVEAHGGRIIALPRDAGGTEIRIDLPRAVATARVA